MKSPLTFSVFLFISFSSFGYNPRVAEITSMKEITILKYKPQVTSASMLILDMDFGSSTIIHSSKIKALKGATIASVDVVYSDFPKDDQYLALTKRRIENLLKLNSKLFSSKSIRWRLLRQSDCTDELSAKELFHGFVIKYRPAQSDELAKTEIDYLKSIVSGSKYSANMVVDTIIPKVFARNKWRNMVIAVDMTGSMSPYTAQLLLWLKLNNNSNVVKQYVFFNDGDRTLDTKKIIGKTGGIYHTRSSKIEDIQDLAYKTMSNGNGGDAPENNIEAVLEAINLCPECETIVMIADNNAPVKDISIASQVNKPVKIIVCGVVKYIHIDYLNLARETGGSVHTMEKDLTDLVKLKEGEEIEINRLTYKIINGRFVLITKS